MEIKEGFDSNYRYVLVAARRARQLQNGSQPLVPSQSHKACRVAQDELDAGLVSYSSKAPDFHKDAPAAEDLPPIAEV